MNQSLHTVPFFQFKPNFMKFFSNPLNSLALIHPASSCCKWAAKVEYDTKASIENLKVILIIRYQDSSLLKLQKAIEEKGQNSSPQKFFIIFWYGRRTRQGKMYFLFSQIIKEVHIFYK